MTDVEPQPEAAPRWVKVLAAAAVVLAAIVVLLMIFGGHGPGKHTLAESTTFQE